MAEYPPGVIAERAFEEREHRELVPGIDRIHCVAGAVGTITAPDLCLALLDVVDWIDEVLAPHAAWEDAWLYPEFDRRAGTAWATSLMSYEHHQILELGRKVVDDRERLRTDPSRAEQGELRGHLFALEAVLRAHIEREQRFLIPLLRSDATVGAVAS